MKKWKYRAALTHKVTGAKKIETGVVKSKDKDGATSKATSQVRSFYKSETWGLTISVSLKAG